MRTPEQPIEKQLYERWSSRAYDPNKKLSNEDLLRLFEAARWAPSSSNEQPWKFYFSKDAASRDLFNTFVNENNRSWAVNASHIIVVTARRNFAASGNPNVHAEYDTGAAVMQLVLQAHAMGLHARQMAGIMRDVIVDKLGLDTANETVLCSIAVGYPGDAAALSERYRALELPNTRKSTSEFTVAV